MEEASVPGAPVPLLRRVTRIVVHHSASPRDRTKRDDIDRWHRERGFRCIGYHFVIEGDGQVRLGRPLPEVGAHAQGANLDSVGVCIVGHNGEPTEAWVPLQVEAARTLIRALRVSFPTIHEVLGHRDVRGTECPGVNVRERLGL